MGLRAWLVCRRAALVMALGSSPKPASVTIGPSGWLFWTGQTLRLRDFALNLSATTFDHALQQLLLVEGALRAEGIKFVVVHVPDKAFFHPEELPSDWQKPFLLHPDSKHRWVHRISEEGKLVLVDPWKALKNSSQPVFRALDNHWTDHGAAITYAELQAVLSEWFPSIQPVPKVERKLVEVGGRQAVVAGRPDLTEPVTELHLPHDWSPSLTFVRDRFWRSLPVVTVGPDPSKPRALVFQTSQGMALQPFLSAQFSRVVYLRWGLSTSWDWVERESPDLVIFLSHDAATAGYEFQPQGLRHWKSLTPQKEGEAAYRVRVDGDSRVLHGVVHGSRPTVLVVSWQEGREIHRATRGLKIGQNAFHITVGETSEARFSFDDPGVYEFQSLRGSPDLSGWARR